MKGLSLLKKLTAPIRYHSLQESKLKRSVDLLRLMYQTKRKIKTMTMMMKMNTEMSHLNKSEELPPNCQHKRKANLLLRLLLHKILRHPPKLKVVTRLEVASHLDCKRLSKRNHSQMLRQIELHLSAGSKSHPRCSHRREVSLLRREVLRAARSLRARLRTLKDQHRHHRLPSRKLMIAKTS